MKYAYIILLFTGLALVSCKEEEPYVSIEEKLLATQNWRVSNVTIAGVSKLDSLMQDSCQHFEYFKPKVRFTGTEDYFVDNSAMVCNGDTLEDELGVFYVHQDQTTFQYLSLNTSLKIITFNVIESSEDIFVVSARDEKDRDVVVTYVKD